MRIGSAPEAFEQEVRGARRLGVWSGLIGIVLVLSTTVPVLATVVMAVWGQDLSGPSDGNKLHGLDVFLGWLLTSLAGLALISVLAITAFTLDILMLVRLDRLRTLRAERVAPLGWSLLAGSGLISTPLLAVLLFVPVTIFGPGPATRVSLVLLLLLMFTLPIAGRVAQVITARRVRMPPQAAGPRRSPLTPGPRDPAAP